MNNRWPQPEARQETLTALRRGLPVILITTVVVTLLAIGLSLRQGPLYKATAQVFVSTDAISSSVEGLPLLSSTPDRILATQARVARVPQVAKAAAKEAGGGVTPSALLDASSVTTEPEADILTFSVTNEDPATAVRLADAYARGYVNYRHRIDTSSLRAARTELQKQIEALGGDPTGDITAGAATAADRLFADLVEQSQNLRTRELLQSKNSSLGTPAESAEKVRPKPVRNGFLGALLGLVLGIALVFLRDALNTRVRTAAEVEERLGLPLLGRIPPPSKRLADTCALAVIEEPHSSQAEAYRMLATNIELLNLERGAKSIMVASAVHAEGKSTTTASLGVSFARRGAHVAILEADMRRPVLHTMVGLKDGTPGLADVALGRVELEEALMRVELSGEGEQPTNGAGGAPGMLEVLVSGPTPPAPAEFLKSQAVADIVSRLSERVDLLLIDTPPLLQLSDALTMMLTSDIDCVIVAVRLGTARRQAIDDVKRTLDGTPVVKLGFFATGAQEEHSGRYGYYAYERRYGLGGRGLRTPPRA